MSKKVLIIGWDGAPYELIKNLVDNNKLPNLKKITENEIFTPLQTVPYTISSSAWSTMVTGKNAGKHGIYDFYSKFVDNTYFRKLSNANDREEPEFWKILEDYGIKTGVINVPFTYPASKINGFMVTGMLCPTINSKGFTYPTNLLDNYKKINQYIFDLEKTKGDSVDSFIQSVNNIIDERTNLILHLIENNTDIDVLFAVYIISDRASHFLWHFYDKTHPYRKNEKEEDLEKYKNILTDLYQQLDAKLGLIMKRFSQNISKEFSTILVSDHGMESVKKVLHINKFLIKYNYLIFKDKENQKIYRTKSLNKEVEYIYGKVDWSRTSAYAVGKRGAIYINLKGREPKGIIEEKDYEALVMKIKDDINTIKDVETGENIVKKVYTRNELFSGKNIHKSPDLLVYLNNGYYPFGYAIEIDKPNLITTNNRTDLPIVTSIESGNGILCIKDEKIIHKTLETTPKIMDFTPTLLYMLDIPIPKDMDGKTIIKGESSKGVKHNV